MPKIAELMGDIRRIYGDEAVEELKRCHPDQNEETTYTAILDEANEITARGKPASGPCTRPTGPCLFRPGQIRVVLPDEQDVASRLNRVLGRHPRRRRLRTA